MKDNGPQLENGFTRIANEIVEALAKSALGFTEGQIILCVLRKTYGWNKKSDKLSISQLSQMTNKSRRMIIYALQNLEAKKIIHIKRGFKEINEISFNKNYHEWMTKEKGKQYQKLHLVQKVAPSAKVSKWVVQKSVKNLPNVAPTKDTNTKETIQKKLLLRNSKTYGNEDINFLQDYFLKVMQIPKEDCSQRQSRQYWQLLLRESTTGKKGVAWLIDIAKQDGFLAPNITSSKDLYYKRVKLITRARGSKPKIAVFGGGGT